MQVRRRLDLYANLVEIKSYAGLRNKVRNLIFYESKHFIYTDTFWLKLLFVYNFNYLLSCLENVCDWKFYIFN